MRISHYILSLITVAILTHTPVPGIADETSSEREQRWYDVEILMFAQGNDQVLQDEVWPEEFSIEGMEDAIELQAPLPADAPEPDVHQPIPFQLLPVDRYQLNEPASHIKRSSRHKLLLHAAWRQPGLSDEDAKNIHISDKITELLQTTGTTNEIIPQEKDYLVTGLPRFEGSIKVVLSRYLHFHIDMRYNYIVDSECYTVQPVTEEPFDSSVIADENDLTMNSTGENGNASWSSLDNSQIEQYSTNTCIQPVRFKESRRMRSKELHFLDHPFLGMLVLITPYEPPEIEESSQQQPAESEAITQPTTGNGTEGTIRRN